MLIKLTILGKKNVINKNGDFRYYSCTRIRSIKSFIRLIIIKFMQVHTVFKLHNTSPIAIVILLIYQ